MAFNRRRSSLLFLALIACVGLGSVTANAHGAVVSAHQYLDIIHREAEVARIDVILAREDVQRRMQALGVTQADAMARVESLTDQELVLLADRLEELPAGGGIVEVVLIVGIVLLILELLDVIDLV